jgi:hypothetical protein
MKAAAVPILALSLAASLSVAAAHAVTFAEYGAVDSNANLEWTLSNSAAGGTLSTTGAGASANTVFTFLTPALSSLADLPARFTLSATAASDTVMAGGQVIEPDFSGTFSFTYTGATPLTVGGHSYTTGANLLSGTFSGAALVGPASGSTAGFQDSSLSGGSVTYTSAIAPISATGDKGLSLELTSVLPLFGAGSGNALGSFTGVSTGSFASDIASNGGGGGIPEPATWAVMLAGFGGIGAAIRSRRRARGFGVQFDDSTAAAASRIASASRR